VPQIQGKLSITAKTFGGRESDSIREEIPEIHVGVSDLYAKRYPIQAADSRFPDRERRRQTRQPQVVPEEFCDPFWVEKLDHMIRGYRSTRSTPGYSLTALRADSRKMPEVRAGESVHLRLTQSLPNPLWTLDVGD